MKERKRERKRERHEEKQIGRETKQEREKEGEREREREGEREQENERERETEAEREEECCCHSIKTFCFTLKNIVLYNILPLLISYVSFVSLSFTFVYLQLVCVSL